MAVAGKIKTIVNRNKKRANKKRTKNDTLPQIVGVITMYVIISVAFSRSITEIKNTDIKAR